jgi:hypothetical protein
MNQETVSYLTHIFNKEGQNISMDTFAAILGRVLTQMVCIDWYFINSHGTYYLEQVKTNHHNDIEFDYSTNSNKQKIVVNVINDNSKNSNHTHSKKRRMHTSGNTLIGSKTMEDLIHVGNNQKSERVAIIDRHDSNNKHGKERLRIFDVCPSIPVTNPSREYRYNTYQQPAMFMSMTANIYSTSYVPNVYSFYPFVYYYY